MVPVLSLQSSSFTSSIPALVMSKPNELPRNFMNLPKDLNRGQKILIMVGRSGEGVPSPSCSTSSKLSLNKMCLALPSSDVP